MDFIGCPGCGVLRIPEENLVHLSVAADPPGPLSLPMRVLLAMRMFWLRRAIPELRKKDITLVDAGCGDGQFLEYLRRRGYGRIFGIEPDAERMAHARARNLDVFADPAQAKAALGERFAANVITVWHVLEHIPCPAPFLRAYADILEEGGTVVVSVPNQKSLQTRLFGLYSAYPDYGRHIWYHDRTYIAWLRKELPQFDLRLLADFNFEYEIFGWVDSLASFLLRRRNFVHRALKKGEGPAVQRIMAVLIAGALLPGAFLLSVFSLGSGYGSTLTFVGRRGVGS